MLGRVLRNLGWGLGMALAGASALSLWVLLISLLTGSTEFEKYNMTTWTIIGTYYVAALLIGTLIGLLRPLTRWRPGAVALGLIGGFIGYSAVGIAMDGWQDFQWWIAAGPGAFVGGACAWIWTRPSKAKGKS